MWLQCRCLAGSHCSHTSSCLLNVVPVSREGGSRLLGAGYAPGRLGEARPPSRVSLAKGARRPRAVLAPVVGDIEANMATVPRRTGDGWPVRRPVAMPVPGCGRSGLYCGHAPSHHRYVGTVLVGAVLAGFLHGRLLGVGFLHGRLLGVGPLGAGSLESAISYLSWGRFLRLGRLLGVGPGDSRPGEGGPMLCMLEGLNGLIIFEELGGVG